MKCLDITTGCAQRQSLDNNFGDSSSLDFKTE